MAQTAFNVNGALSTNFRTNFSMNHTTKVYGQGEFRSSQN